MNTIRLSRIIWTIQMILSVCTPCSMFAAEAGLEGAFAERWTTVRHVSATPGFELALKVNTTRLTFGEEIRVICEVCNTDASPHMVYKHGLILTERCIPPKGGRELRPDEGRTPPLNRRIERQPKEVNYLSLEPDECYSRSITFTPHQYGELLLTLSYEGSPEEASPPRMKGECMLVVKIDESGALGYLSAILKTNTSPARRAEAVVKLRMIGDRAVIPPLVQAARSDADAWVRCLAVTALQEALGLPVDPLPDLRGIDRDAGELMHNQKNRIDLWLSTRTNSVLREASKYHGTR